MGITTFVGEDMDCIGVRQLYLRGVLKRANEVPLAQLKPGTKIVIEGFITGKIVRVEQLPSEPAVLVVKWEDMVDEDFITHKYSDRVWLLET